jgi:hypothetical protein
MDSNVCPRCGKQRVNGKTWSEGVGASKVKIVMTVCPDKACQKIVDSQYKDEKDKRDAQTKARQDAKAKNAPHRTNIRL